MYSGLLPCAAVLASNARAGAALIRLRVRGGIREHLLDRPAPTPRQPTPDGTPKPRLRPDATRSPSRRRAISRSTAFNARAADALRKARLPPTPQLLIEERPSAPPARSAWSRRPPSAGTRRRSVCAGRSARTQQNVSRRLVRPIDLTLRDGRVQETLAEQAVPRLERQAVVRAATAPRPPSRSRGTSRAFQCARARKTLTKGEPGVRRRCRA